MPNCQIAIVDHEREIAKAKAQTPQPFGVVVEVFYQRVSFIA